MNTVLTTIMSQESTLVATETVRVSLTALKTATATATATITQTTLLPMQSLASSMPTPVMLNANTIAATVLASDAPLIALGLLAFGVGTGLAVMARPSHQSFVLLSASIFDFLSSVFDLSQLLLTRGTAGKQVLALSIITEIFLAAGVSAKFLWLFLFSGGRRRILPKRDDDVESGGEDGKSDRYTEAMDGRRPSPTAVGQGYDVGVSRDTFAMTAEQGMRIASSGRLDRKRPQSTPNAAQVSHFSIASLVPEAGAKVVSFRTDRPPSWLSLGPWFGLLVRNNYLFLLVALSALDPVWRIGFLFKLVPFLAVYQVDQAIQIALLVLVTLVLVARTWRGIGEEGEEMVLCASLPVTSSDSEETSLTSGPAEPAAVTKTLRALPTAGTKRRHRAKRLLPVFIGNAIGLGVAITGIPIFGFTETPLGRLLLAVQLYVYTIFVLIAELLRPRGIDYDHGEPTPSPVMSPLSSSSSLTKRPMADQQTGGPGSGAGEADAGAPQPTTPPLSPTRVKRFQAMANRASADRGERVGQQSLEDSIIFTQSASGMKRFSQASDSSWEAVFQALDQERQNRKRGTDGNQGGEAPLTRRTVAFEDDDVYRERRRVLAENIAEQNEGKASKVSVPRESSVSVISSLDLSLLLDEVYQGASRASERLSRIAAFDRMQKSLDEIRSINIRDSVATVEPGLTRASNVPTLTSSQISEALSKPGPEVFLRPKPPKQNPEIAKRTLRERQGSIGTLPVKFQLSTSLIPSPSASGADRKDSGLAAISEASSIISGLSNVLGDFPDPPKPHDSQSAADESLRAERFTMVTQRSSAVDGAIFDVLMPVEEEEASDTGDQGREGSASRFRPEDVTDAPESATLDPPRPAFVSGVVNVDGSRRSGDMAEDDTNRGTSGMSITSFVEYLAAPQPTLTNPMDRAGQDLALQGSRQESLNLRQIPGSLRPAGPRGPPGLGSEKKDRYKGQGSSGDAATMSSSSSEALGGLRAPRGRQNSDEEVEYSFIEGMEIAPPPRASQPRPLMLAGSAAPPPPSTSTSSASPQSRMPSPDAALPRVKFPGGDISPRLGSARLASTALGVVLRPRSGSDGDVDLAAAARAARPRQYMSAALQQQRASPRTSSMAAGDGSPSARLPPSPTLPVQIRPVTKIAGVARNVVIKGPYGNSGVPRGTSAAVGGRRRDGGGEVERSDDESAPPRPFERPRPAPLVLKQSNKDRMTVAIGQAF